MSNLSCVPAIILLNGALHHYGLKTIYFHPHHYGLKTIYFHPEKSKDKLLYMHQRALMSQKIQYLIPAPKLDELRKLFVKKNRKRIGYTRAPVLNTTHETGHQAANDYIHWYNLNKFAHLPVITGVRKNEVTDTATIAQIGLKYPELRPAPVLPVDEASEPEVEDESPNSNTTREEEGSPPAANVDNGELLNPTEDAEDDVAEPAARHPGGLFATICRNGREPYWSGTVCRSS